MPRTKSPERPGLLRRFLQRAILGKTYNGDGRAGAGGWNTLYGTCVINDSTSIFRTYTPQEIYALQKTSSLVATCANKIASSVRNGDLAIWSEGEDGPERVEAEESEEGAKARKARRTKARRLRGKALSSAPESIQRFAALLKNPNPYMSQGDLVEVLAKGLVLVGDVYLWIWRDAYGMPVELWPIPKTWVTAVKDESGKIIAYKIWQGADSEEKAIPSEDLVRIWNPNAESPMDAIGAAEIVSRELQLDDERAAYLMELLKNVPFAGAVFKQKTEWDTDQKNEIKAKVNENIGRGARGSVAFVSGENAGVDFPNPMADLDWPGLASYLESRVSAAIDIPAIVAGFRIGLEHGTYANYKEANKMFYRGRVSSLGLKIGEALTRGVVYAEAPASGYWIAFDWSEVDAMQEDEAEKETRVLNRLKGMAITRNEARVSLGEDTVLGGDVFLDSAGVVPTPADADPWSGDAGRKPGDPPLNWSEEPAGSQEGAEGMPEKTGMQDEGADVDLALNGAQVMAARQIVADVVFGDLPEETAIQMLITMFNVPEAVARKMVGPAAELGKKRGREPKPPAGEPQAASRRNGEAKAPPFTPNAIAVPAGASRGAP